MGTGLRWEQGFLWIGQWYLLDCNRDLTSGKGIKNFQYTVWKCRIAYVQTPRPHLPLSSLRERGKREKRTF